VKRPAAISWARSSEPVEDRQSCLSRTGRIACPPLGAFARVTRHHARSTTRAARVAIWRSER
jgi:hypothetical protein